MGLGLAESQGKFQFSRESHENKGFSILLGLPGLTYRQNGAFQSVVLLF